MEEEEESTAVRVRVDEEGQWWLHAKEFTTYLRSMADNAIDVGARDPDEHQGFAMFTAGRSMARLADSIDFMLIVSDSAAQGEDADSDT